MANILWIEDEASKLKGLIRPLIKNDDLVTIALTKKEAIHAVESKLYDLIILDIIIPNGIDPDKIHRFNLNEYEGIEFLKYMNHKKIQMPVLVLSVVDDKDAIEQIYNLGAINVLRKGAYYPSDLKKEVDSILGR
jgi:DNA-binding NarL/FixJ family response regulator